MSATESSGTESRTYRATSATGPEIALPEELGRAIGVAAGDIVEVRVRGNQLVLQRSQSRSSPSPRGLLRDYFSSREEIERFIEEERSGWEARDKLLEKDRELLWERFSTSTD